MSEFLNLDRENRAQQQLQKRSVFLFLLVSVLGTATLFQLFKLTILDSTLYTTLSMKTELLVFLFTPLEG